MLRNYEELRKDLAKIDGKGYKAYKNLEGRYAFPNYILSIDHVQGDPFASPSRFTVIVSQEKAQFPTALFDTEIKRVAVVDYLTRLFSQNISFYYDKVRGSGKSGVLTIQKCGQEILDRTSIFINAMQVEARFEVGLPARGRSVLGKEAEEIIFQGILKIVENTLFYNTIEKAKLTKQVQLVEDQAQLRMKMKEKGLIAFVANGAILPRKSGISDKPMVEGAVPFQSPPTLEVEIMVPNQGQIKGMGIPRGVALIVGGGYHGKSTLLRALEVGVYNHIEGDGREFVVTDEAAVKILAENGRSIEKVDISSFINNLPNKKDTKRFSTENASGSTSQAANIIEALEVEASALLIDEDTSATNFMIRDAGMQSLVTAEQEPIIPFVDRIRELYEEKGVSSILVIGSSSTYFSKADTVIMMDAYRCKEVTAKAKEIGEKANNQAIRGNVDRFTYESKRILLHKSFPKTSKGAKIKANGIYNISYNQLSMNLHGIEQIVDKSQTNAIVYMFQYIIKYMGKGQYTISEIANTLVALIEKEGLDVISPEKGIRGNIAMPRRQEIAAVLNRFPYLQIK